MAIQQTIPCEIRCDRCNAKTVVLAAIRFGMNPLYAVPHWDQYPVGWKQAILDGHLTDLCPTCDQEIQENS